MPAPTASRPATCDDGGAFVSPCEGAVEQEHDALWNGPVVLWLCRRHARLRFSDAETGDMLCSETDEE